MPFVRLSRLASHPRALRGSSAYPNRTSVRHWRPTPRREEASTNPVERSGGEPAMLQNPRLAIILFAVLCSLCVLADSVARPAKDRSPVAPTAKQEPVRTD